MSKTPRHDPIKKLKLKIGLQIGMPFDQTTLEQNSVSALVGRSGTFLSRVVPLSRVQSTVRGLRG